MSAASSGHTETALALHEAGADLEKQQNEHYDAIFNGQFFDLNQHQALAKLLVTAMSLDESSNESTTKGGETILLL